MRVRKCFAGRVPLSINFVVKKIRLVVLDFFMGLRGKGNVCGRNKVKQIKGRMDAECVFSDPKGKGTTAVLF